MPDDVFTVPKMVNSIVKRVRVNDIMRPVMQAIKAAESSTQHSFQSQLIEKTFQFHLTEKTNGP